MARSLSSYAPPNKERTIDNKKFMNAIASINNISSMFLLTLAFGRPKLVIMGIMETGGAGAGYIKPDKSFTKWRIRMDTLFLHKITGRYLTCISYKYNILLSKKRHTTT